MCLCVWMCVCVCVRVCVCMYLHVCALCVQVCCEDACFFLRAPEDSHSLLVSDLRVFVVAVGMVRRAEARWCWGSGPSVSVCMNVRACVCTYECVRDCVVGARLL